MPIFGQLAGALADAGYLVVRFDKRGVGQSGGRTENATVATYAEDVVGIVNWLRRQKDVDPERIAVVGHGEGAAIAMTAATRERRIRAVALVAGPGRTGRDVTVEQQQLALARSEDSAAVKDAKMQLQLRVNEAVGQRHRLGARAAGRAAPGRHAVVPKLAAVRSDRDDLEDSSSRC